MNCNKHMCYICSKTALDYAHERGTDIGKEMARLLSDAMKPKFRDTTLKTLKASKPKLDTGSQLSSTGEKLSGADIDTSKQTTDTRINSTDLKLSEADIEKSKQIKISKDFKQFKDGIFKLKEDDNVLLSFPHTSPYDIEAIYVNIQPVPAEELFSKEDIVSDMITVMPHGLIFEEHVMIRIPIARSNVKDIKTVQLLYCPNHYAAKDRRKWINISSASLKPDHSAPVFFFIHENHCYLFTRHFSCFFLVQKCDQHPQRGLSVIFSIWANLEAQLITACVHCRKHQPDLLKNCKDFGHLLGFHQQCFFENEGDVKISFKVQQEHWKILVPEIMMPIDEVFRLCYIDLHCKTVQYRKENRGMSQNSVMEVLVSQGSLGNRIEINTSLILPKMVKDACVMTVDDDKISTLNLEQATITMPETVKGASVLTEGTEHNKGLTWNMELACPAESTTTAGSDIVQDSAVRNRKSQHETSISDIGHATVASSQANQAVVINKGQYTSGPLYCENTPSNRLITYNREEHHQSIIFANGCIPEQIFQQALGFPGMVTKICDAIFHPFLQQEQEELCEIIDKECQQILQDITQVLPDATANNNNIQGIHLLQMYNTLVIDGKKTWKCLYDSFKAVGSDESAKKLQEVVDKDNLARNIKKIQQYVNYEDISSGVFQEGLVSQNDYQELERMTPNKAVGRLVILLMKKPYEKIQSFHQILCDEQIHSEILEKIMICPEQLLQIEN